VAIKPLCTPDVHVKGSGLQGEAHPIRCKMWSCPTCAELNRKKVIAKALEAKPRAMLTLTVSSKNHASPEEAAAALKRGLRLLRLRLKRDEKLSNFEFIAVFEKHQSGFPHLHLLITGKFIPWSKLQQWWKEITGSTHVDIRKIKNAGTAAFYCAKYIGKDLAAFEGCKRWWRSHGYRDPNPEAWIPDYALGRGTTYEVDLNGLAFAMRLEGLNVSRLKSGGIAWRAPPDIDAPLGYYLWGAAGGSTPRKKGGH
jgi:hypothetical protein